MEVNKRFFMDAMRDRSVSLREVARRIDVWPAALSRSFDGKRKMQLPEAVRLSQVLNVPLAEVLRNAGIQEAQTIGRRCSIIGHLVDSGVVKPLPAGTIERTPVPEGLPDGVVAVQAHTADTPAAYSDGWIYFFSAEATDPAALINRFVLATTEDDVMIMGTLRRGYESGTYNLVGPTSSPVKSVRLKSVQEALITVHSGNMQK